MNRADFMRELEGLLADISLNEREEALQYYNNYFDDAGIENEAEVIAALGSPRQVAKTVKEGIGEEFTETSYVQESENLPQAEVSDAASRQQDTEGQYQTGDAYITNGTYNTGADNAGSQGAAAGKSRKKTELPTWALVLIIIGLIIGSPLIIAIACTIFAAAFSILITLASIIFAFAVTALALVIAGIAIAAGGVAALFAEPLEGAAMTGAGLICTAIGIVFVNITVFLAAVCLPKFVKWLISLFKKNKKKENTL